jgi:hypothetical protein
MFHAETYLIIACVTFAGIAGYYASAARRSYKQGFADGGKFRNIVREKAVWSDACEAQRVECANQFGGIVIITKIMNTPDAEFDATR